MIDDTNSDDTVDAIHRLVLQGASVTDGARRRRAAVSLAQKPPDIVAAETERVVLQAVERVWAMGWTPAELARRARPAGPAAEALLALVAAADLARWPVADVHPRWRSLVEDLAAPPTEPVGWLHQFTWQCADGWVGALDAALAVVAACVGVPPLEALVPPPGGARSDAYAAAAANAAAWAAAVGGDSPDLRRVRQLLAQAESTTFPEEAATFTAKAQEIASRHAIDLATAWGRTGRREGPVVARFPIEDPYRTQKSYLLQTIARRSRCHAVDHGAIGLTSVVGFPSDVLHTEMLFTSLLLQSQVELLAITSTAATGSRERSRGFRASFLTGFSIQVGRRLDEVEASVVAEATAAGPSLVPVLAERRDVVDDAFTRMFTVRVRPVHLSDHAGWERGRQAAERADLGRGGLAGVRRGLGRAG